MGRAECHAPHGYRGELYTVRFRLCRQGGAGVFGALPGSLSPDQLGVAGQNILDSLDIIDVGVETVAQGLGGNKPDLFAHGNLEQGLMETIESFQSRPLSNQILLSVVDPVIVLKAPRLLALSAKGGIHATSRGINWTATHGPNFAFRDALAKFTQQDVQRNIQGKLSPQRLLRPCRPYRN